MAVKPPPGMAARSAALNRRYGLPPIAKPPPETPLERLLRIRAESGKAGWGGDASVSTPGAGTTTAPTAPPPAGKIHVPGFDPDYEAILKADPTLLSNEADLNDLLPTIDNARRDAIRRAVIAAGFSPTGGPSGDIDQATLDAAGLNQNSTRNTIEEEAMHRGTDLHSLLAARGILDSGGLTGGEQRIQQNRDRTSQQAIQNLLDSISGYEGSAADKKAAIRQQIASLREQAALRVMQDPRYQPVGQTDAVLDPKSGLYVTPDGRWYHPDGTPADDPTGSTGAGGNPPATPPSGAAVNDPSNSPGSYTRPRFRGGDAFLDPVGMF